MTRTRGEKIGLALPLILALCAFGVIVENWIATEEMNIPYLVLLGIATIMFVMRWRDSAR